MKIIKEEILIDEGGFGRSDTYKKLRQHIETAIAEIVWPDGNSQFAIYPGKKANGVLPIRKSFQRNIEKHGWDTETRLDVGVAERRPGPLDATYQVSNQHFAIEWETGNISSSHRALNKMVIGMLRGVLAGGALILPTRKLYTYLTDRVGNFQELEPYFDVWRSVRCSCGLLLAIAVEYDATSLAVARIPKGTDGRARG